MTRSQDRKSRRAAAVRKQAIALGSLLLIAGAIWGRAIFFGSPKIASGGPGERSEAADQAPSDGDQGAVGKTVRLDWPEALQRNPFEMDTSAYRRRVTDDAVVPPPVEPVEHGPEQPAIEELIAGLVLQGTSVSDDPIAVINHQWYRVGDSVNGLIIKRIGERFVVLEKDGAEARLEM